MRSKNARKSVNAYMCINSVYTAVRAAARLPLPILCALAADVVTESAIEVLHTNCEGERANRNVCVV